MGKNVYREKIETINSILQASINSENSVSKFELMNASRTSYKEFEKIYKALIHMGCLKEEKSTNPSRKYEVTPTDKGLEFLRRSSNVMPFLEEFKKYWKG